jgi:hypothetical protein
LLPRLQTNTWEIGAEIYSFKYEESIMEEEGTFLGFSLGYTHRPWVADLQPESESDGGVMFSLEGRIAVGKVDYDGALLDGTPYKVDNIDDYTFETRAILGRDLLGSNAVSAIYTGLGYRYLNDDLSKDPAGYEREANYIYVPIGYQFATGLGSGWSWGARLEYDFFIWGEQRSHLGDVHSIPPEPGIETQQERGHGYRASLRLQRQYPDGVVVIEPFFRFWEIEDSNLDRGWFEPANETNEYGIHFVWRF